MQNLSPKDIAKSNIMKLKLSQCPMSHGQERVNLKKEKSMHKVLLNLPYVNL